MTMIIVIHITQEQSQPQLVRIQITQMDPIVTMITTITTTTTTTIDDDNEYDDDSDYTQETTSDNKVYKYHKRIQYDSSEDAYDDGYDDIYDDGDYDYDRYDNDEDYAEGVDDAMAEIDW